MARNILRAGFDLTVYNRSPDNVKPLVAEGARSASTPMAAVDKADVVITCLMDDNSVMNVVTNEQGLLVGLKPGGIHIGTATISPSCAADLDELHKSHGSYYIAAPIFGRPDAAEAGTLLTYIAGNPDAIADCDELFAAYTKTHINMGEDVKIVNSLKLAMNFMVIALVEMISEVYAFAEKSGVDLEFTEELIMTVLRHPVFSEYTKRIRTRDFEPAAFDMSAGFKDVTLMLQASTEVQAPLPFAGAISEKFITALALGMANKDWSAIYEISRRNAGLP
jgi:3-hydroxyisobutyrate dehydrogenase-like beta-hydroxyacid dehydrogenase